MDQRTSTDQTDPDLAGDPSRAPIVADRVGMRLKERSIAARLFGTEPEAEPITLGRFNVLRKLGEGGMGVVYAAYDATLDREVALKLIRATPGEARRTEARLAAEGRAMARLAHPNVATVFEVGEHEGQVFIAMELVPGVTLRQWLARPRPWQEIFDVLVRAGRGLAAAHAAGLVHRDFKPENVMVGPAERGQISSVKVMDFGLARGTSSLLSTQREHQGPASTLSNTTQRARWAGTPAYMAPEQLEGGTIDARCDQFSFCVTAYEALCGRRPFLGNDLGELHRSMKRPPPAPSNTDAPRRITDAILRGLAHDPDARFETMSALLHAMQHDRWAKARRTGLASTAIVLVGLTGFAAARLNREAPCSPPDERVADLWSPSRQDRIAHAFEQAGVQHASGSWTATAALVDDYVTRWSRAKIDACRATRIEATQSEEVLDLRTACLERRFAELDRLLDYLEEPDAETIARAPMAVSGLRPLSACADVVALRERRDAIATADPVAVAELTNVLDAADALLDLGRPIQAQQEASGTVGRAEAIGDPSLLARALLIAGRTELDLGNEAAAADLLERSMLEALAGGDAELLATSTTLFAAALADGSDDYERALAILDIAEAALRRAGNPWRARQTWHDRRGHIMSMIGRYDDAAQDYGAALRLAAEARPPRPQLAAQARTRLAYLQVIRGRGGSAIDEFTDAVQTCERELGPTHPECAAMHERLSAVYVSRMRWTDAEHEAKLAIERLEAAFGPDHLQLTAPLRSLGVALHRTGRYDEAETIYLRAREVLRKHRGPESTFEATLEDDLAKLYQSLGRLEEAERSATAALEITRRHRGDDNVAVAEHLDALTTIVAQQGDYARARSVVEQTFEVLDRLGLPDHRLRSTGLNTLGMIARAEGDRDEALTWFKRAAEHAASALNDPGNQLAIPLYFVASLQTEAGQLEEARETFMRVLAVLDEMDGSNPMLDGMARFEFALLLWPTDRALALEQAQRAYASLAPIDREHATTVETWLDAHGGTVPG